MAADVDLQLEGVEADPRDVLGEKLRSSPPLVEGVKSNSAVAEYWSVDVPTVLRNSQPSCQHRSPNPSG